VDQEPPLKSESPGSKDAGQVPQAEARPNRIAFLKNVLSNLRRKANPGKLENPENKPYNAAMVEGQTPNDFQEEVDKQALSFPHGEIALKAFKKAFPNDPEKQATMGRVIDAFFRQEMDNTAIFTDSRGASLPYTKINVTELARAVTGISQPDTAQPTDAAVPKHVRFFVLPSFPALQNGHQFTFVEVAMKQAMKYLPAVADDLRNGRTPKDVEVYTLGSPTNKKWGRVTPEYLKLLQEDAYGTIGNTNADLIAGTLPENPQDRAKTSIVVFGQSMSASIAAVTAEKLIDRGQATQDYAKRSEGTPYVQVIMDAPVTLNPSTHRKGQINTGFAIDAMHSSITSSHIRKSALGEAKFVDRVAVVLTRRGIKTNEDEQEIKLKGQAKNTVMNAMYKKRMPVDSSKIRVNIRRGMYDMTNPPFRFARQAWGKLHSYGEQKRAPIGKYLVDDPQLDVVNTEDHQSRESAVRGTHIFSVIFSKHEIQKWGKDIDRINKVSQLHQAQSEI